MFTLGYDVNRIKKDFYQCSMNHQFTVIETSADGQAEVEVHFATKKYEEYYQLQKENSAWLQFTVNSKCPDGIFVCVFYQEDLLLADIHIVELKTTMTSQKWSEVLHQYRGGILRALSFSVTLGVQHVRDIHLYSGAVDKSKIDSDYAIYQAQKRTSSGVAKKRKTGLNEVDLQKWSQPMMQLFSSGGRCTHRFFGLSRSNAGVNIGRLEI